MSDAIVIGSGPNGLVAANVMADAGWTVTVLEAQDTFGGGVRSSEALEPGFINDHCSAFYPLAEVSPAIRDLRLQDYGLTWRHAPLVLAHPSSDGTCPTLSRNLDRSVAAFEASASGDGDAWRRLFGLWEEVGSELTDVLFGPFPPVKASGRLLRGTAWKELVRLARFALLPVRTLGEEHFESDASRRLLAGLSLHSDLMPEATLSGFYGWLLAVMGQQAGFPAPEGGAGALSGAMVRRLQSKGGQVVTNAAVAEVVVRNGRAQGVMLAGGDYIEATKAVVADVDAAKLYTSLLDERHVPFDVRRDIMRFQRDSATVKIDWNLDGPVPWSAPDAREAAVVHIGDSVDELSEAALDLVRGNTPQRPFVLLGQQSMCDTTRAPAGKETVWAYTHVPWNAQEPGGGWTESRTAAVADMVEQRIESLAPGFRDLIRKRRVLSPGDLEASDANLVQGGVGGGTAQLHQQLVFRPVPGLARPETPVPGLYLASSAAHPGGGVHGACGANAAHAALHGKTKSAFIAAVRWAGERQSRNKARITP